MKAVLVEKDSLKWSEVSNPVIKDDEVLIKIQAFGINRADLMQRAGDYPSPAGSPPWMGLEVSGIIAEMGSLAREKSSLHIGDGVCALLGGGGYAEYVAARYDQVMPIPRGFSYEEAAAIPETYATAYLNLFHEGNLKKGETFLMFAAASGVGISALQLAKAKWATVIATARSDEKVAVLRELGADLAVNSEQNAVEDLFHEREIDLVIDCVGGEQMGRCFGLMARGGRWVQIAALGGSISSIDLKLSYQKGLRFMGSTLRSRPLDVKAAVLSALVKDVYPLFEGGIICPLIHRVFSQNEIELAQNEMAQNKNIGKIIVRMNH